MKLSSNKQQLHKWGSKPVFHKGGRQVSEEHTDPTAHPTPGSSTCLQESSEPPSTRGFCPSSSRHRHATPSCIQSTFKSLEWLHIYQLSGELIKEFGRAAFGKFAFTWFYLVAPGLFQTISIHIAHFPLYFSVEALTSVASKLFTASVTPLEGPHLGAAALSPSHQQDTTCSHLWQQPGSAQLLSPFYLWGCVTAHTWAARGSCPQPSVLGTPSLAAALCRLLNSRQGVHTCPF